MNSARITQMNVNFAKMSSVVSVMYVQATFGTVLIQEAWGPVAKVMGHPKKEAKLIWD